MKWLGPMLTLEEFAVDRHRRRARINDLRAANARLADRGQKISEITLARIKRSHETLAKSRARVAKFVPPKGNEADPVHVSRRVLSERAIDMVGLSPKEWKRLLVYCADHEVAQCLSCERRFRQHELTPDSPGDRTYICPVCRTDLTEVVRNHLESCAMHPRTVRHRALALQLSLRNLMKESQLLLATRQARSAN
jgi:hypothetical protein